MAADGFSARILSSAGMPRAVPARHVVRVVDERDVNPVEAEAVQLASMLGAGRRRR